MITKVIIDNFELDLRPFQVFVGPNDSGKSTILQAHDLLGRFTMSVLGRAPTIPPVLIEHAMLRTPPANFEPRVARFPRETSCAQVRPRRLLFCFGGDTN